MKYLNWKFLVPMILIVAAGMAAGVFLIGNKQEPLKLNTEAVVVKELVYRDTQYGFEINYPNDWLVTKDQESILFERKNVRNDSGTSRGLVIATINVSTTSARSIDEWFKNEFSARGELIPTPKALSIGGQQGLTYSDPVSEGGCDQDYVFMKGDMLYKIRRDSSTCDYAGSVFDNFVGSFRLFN